MLLPSSEQRARMLPPIARETQMAFEFLSRGSHWGRQPDVAREPLGLAEPTLKAAAGGAARRAANAVHSRQTERDTGVVG